MGIPASFRVPKGTPIIRFRTLHLNAHREQARSQNAASAGRKAYPRVGTGLYTKAEGKGEWGTLNKML